MTTKPLKPRRAWRRSRYYKVQIFHDRFAAWRDERGAFDTVEEARRHIAERIAPRRARIMVVDREERHVLEDD